MKEPLETKSILISSPTNLLSKFTHSRVRAFFFFGLLGQVCKNFRGSERSGNAFLSVLRRFANIGDTHWEPHGAFLLTVSFLERRPEKNLLIYSSVFVCEAIVFSWKCDSAGKMLRSTFVAILSLPLVGGSVVTLTDADFQDSVMSPDKTSFVKFYAPWYIAT